MPVAETLWELQESRPLLDEGPGVGGVGFTAVKGKGGEDPHKEARKNHAVLHACGDVGAGTLCFRGDPGTKLRNSDPRILFRGCSGGHVYGNLSLYRVKGNFESSIKVKKKKLPFKKKKVAVSVLY